MPQNKNPLPKKRLGQHFLIDPSIPDTLITELAASPCDFFIEIGPGLGALTLPLLEKEVRVYALELDTDVIPTLLDKTKNYPTFKCIHADATVFDYGSLFAEYPHQKWRVVGNLPYNVATPILFHLWDFIDHLEDMTFMLQKEVVDRMVALPGNRDYGRLSMMTHYFCEPTALFTVPPSCFNPPPLVDSQFIKLKPHSAFDRSVIDPLILSVWVKRLFQFPRKTVWNNLKNDCSLSDLLKARINPQDRPQEIPLTALVRLISLTDQSHLAGLKA